MGTAVQKAEGVVATFTEHVVQLTASSNSFIKASFMAFRRSGRFQATRPLESVIFTVRVVNSRYSIVLPSLPMWLAALLIRIFNAVSRRRQWCRSPR